MKAVGIDLGTTNSAVAHVDDQGMPAIVPNRAGAATTPSVICFSGGDVVVGAEAKELQRAGAAEVAAFFKRQMGVAGFRLYLADRERSATDLSALLLAHLREEAEERLGTPVTHAVVTVPAYFRNPQREATIEAGRRAGLEVMQTVNEPTAAAIAFGCRQARDEQSLLVYDLGGGTFDVTLLRIETDRIRVLTSQGDHELGGKDWDLRIVDFLGSRFLAEHGVDPLDDAESIAELLVAAEDAKRRLSSLERTNVVVRHQGRRGRYELDRASFAEMTVDLMERTLAFTDGVLEEQGLTAPDLDGILLVGGSTRMPMVSEALERRLGLPPRHGVNVDEAVALGAAVLAEQLAAELPSSPRPRFSLAVRTVDVTNHSLGMIALDETGDAYVNSIILRKDAEIPCEESRPFLHTVGPRPRDLEVYMTQGESEDPDAVTYLGKYVIADVPPGEEGRQVVDIQYRYDASGTVRVAARARSSGDPLTVRVEPLPEDVPGRFLLPPEEVEAPHHTTVYLAFDLSGSMSGRPLAEAQRAAEGFLRDLDLAHTSMGLCIFADRVRIPLAASQNAREIQRAVAGLEIGEVGFGNDTDPFRELHAELEPIPGRRLIVVLADGVWFGQEAAARRARRCHEDDVEVIAIGFGGADEGFLGRIASTEENSLFTTVDGLTQAFSGIAQVITESSALQAPAARGLGLRQRLARGLRRDR